MLLFSLAASVVASRAADAPGASAGGAEADASADVSIFMEEMSSLAPVAPIHVQLSCDCGATRCNCLKVCDCKLPASFLEMPTGSEPRRRRHRSRAAEQHGTCASWERAPGESGWEAVPADDVPADDTGFSFLEEQSGASLNPGLNQPMECDCEKVKCTCLRKCECDSSAAAVSVQSHLQLSHGLGDDPAGRGGRPSVATPARTAASNASATNLMAQPTAPVQMTHDKQPTDPSAVLRQLQALAPAPSTDGYDAALGLLDHPQRQPDAVATAAGALQPGSPELRQKMRAL